MNRPMLSVSRLGLFRLLAVLSVTALVVTVLLTANADTRFQRTPAEFAADCALIGGEFVTDVAAAYGCFTDEFDQICQTSTSTCYISCQPGGHCVDDGPVWERLRTRLSIDDAARESSTTTDSNNDLGAHQTRTRPHDPERPVP